MPVYGLYAKPNVDFVALSTTALSMTNPVTAYPAANLANKNPGLVAKASANNTVITMNGTSNVTIEGFCIFNHNLYGATVTLANGAGYSQTITIPARRSSGAVVNAWRDCRLDSNRTDDDWTLTITGAGANVEIGRLYLVEQWIEFPYQWDIEWEDERILVEPMETFYRHKVIYDTLTNIRRAKGTVVSHTAFLQLYDLFHAAKGMYQPFPVIPDYTQNDALYMQFANSTLKWKYQAPNYTPVDVILAEASAGPPAED